LQIIKENKDTVKIIEGQKLKIATKFEHIKDEFIVNTTDLLKENLNEVGTNAVILEVKNKPAKWYKVVVKNVDVLPAFHPGKGSKGWIFIDEVFFNK
jgi:hypothetical protein